MPSACTDFGEIQSGYDARALNNPMTIMDDPLTRGLRRNRIRQYVYIVGEIMS